MIPFFAYLIKSSVVLALLYCMFRFTLRNENHHVLNRFFLLGILFASAVIPLLNVQLFDGKAQVVQVEVLRELIPVSNTHQSVLSGPSEPGLKIDHSSTNLWMLFYLGGIAIFITLLTISLSRVFQIINKAEKRRFHKVILAIVKENIQPFAFLNRIVLSRQDYCENKNIVLTHEYAHIKHLHAIDLIVCELFTFLHFFNPFMWLLRSDLKLVHEYQADKEVLKKGIDARKYQLHILERTVGKRRFAIANHFIQKHISKRLLMMNKKNKNRWVALKLFLFTPIMILLIQAFSMPDIVKYSKEIVLASNQNDQKEKWSEKWTIENVRNGFFQSETILLPRNLSSFKNTFSIVVNRKNKIILDYKHVDKKDIKQIVTSFLQGENRIWHQNIDFVEKEIPFAGKMNVSIGVIYFWNEPAASSETLNIVLRNIGEAYLDVRNEKAELLFEKDYFELNPMQQEAVDRAVPIRFSYLPSKKAPPPPPPPSVIVKLFKDKISVDDNFVQNEYEDAGLSEISKIAKDYWKRNNKLWGGRSHAQIFVDEGITDNQVNLVVTALRKSGMKRYKVKAMD